MEQTNSVYAVNATATSISVPLSSLEMIAAQANIYDLLTNGPSLPPGWDIIKQPFANERATDKVVPVPTQGYMVKITVKDNNNQNVQVDILALGCAWIKYFQYQYNGAFTLGTLPPEIAGRSVPPQANVLSVYSIAYQFLRRPLWNAVVTREDPSRPLFICGHGLGAPLAQIAALDLRIGNFGPADPATGLQPIAPSTPTPCYTFSNANFANSAMQSYYKDTVTAPVIATRAGSSGNDVDQWPISPSNLVLLGTLNQVNASLIPDEDDPWWERATIFYTRTLGGNPLPNQPEPVNIPNIPAGFSRDMAFSLSKMTMMAYHWTQHPDSQTKAPSLNYTFVTKINSEGAPWAYLFTGDTNNSIIVVFRGATNWNEFNSYAACSVFAATPWYTDPSAHVHKGAYTLYEGMTAALKAALQPYSSRKLFFAGHSLGGAIANIAASDYAISNYRPVEAVYTFGSIMSANYTYAQKFNEVLGTKSYQIRRPNDRITTGLMSIGYEPVNTGVLLRGELEYEEPDYHNLLHYKKLLDTAKA